MKKSAKTHSFRSMDESSAQEWRHILDESDRYSAQTPDRMMALLRSLEDVTCGFAVDQLVHVTQTATRAERAEADEEMILAALCHDVGKAVDLLNHPAVAAALIKPYVRPEVEWVLRVHQDFQGLHFYEHLGMYPHARDQHRSSPWFEAAARFADEWDQVSFDPDYDTLPLEHFEPLIRSVLSHPRLNSPVTQS
jgi:predicted HD phosphohydrolase